jgi:hypothetical protein
VAAGAVRTAPDGDLEAVADGEMTAVLTSSALWHWAITAGRRSIAAFQTRRASS